VEIKCKRCEKVNLFEENYAQKIPAPLTLEIDGAKLVEKPDSQTYN
jgi:hypothetical protein